MAENNEPVAGNPGPIRGYPAIEPAGESFRQVEEARVPVGDPRGPERPREKQTADATRTEQSRTLRPRDNRPITQRHPARIAPAARALPPPSGPAEIQVATYLGDEKRSLYGRGPVPEKLDLLWTYAVGSGVTRINAQRPREVWAGTGWTGQPNIVRQGGRDYLVIGGYDHNLRRVDLETGREVWRYAFDDVIKGTSTLYPTKDGDVIIVQGSRLGFKNSLASKEVLSVRAVSFNTGKPVWMFNVPRTDSYSRDADGSPLWSKEDGLLLMPSENGYFYFLDPNDLEQKGSHLEPKIVKSFKLYTDNDKKRHGGNLVAEASPSRIGDTLHIAAGSGHVYGIDKKKGEITWDFFIGSDLDGSSVVTEQGNLLVPVEKQYIDGPGGVFMLDPKKPPSEAVLWYLPTPDQRYGDWLGGVLGTPAINDRTTAKGLPRLVAVRGIDGNLFVVSQDDVQSGRKVRGPDNKSEYATPKILYQEKIGPSISTPLFIDDRIVTAGYDGRLRVYKVTYEPTGAPGPDTASGAGGKQYKVKVDLVASRTLGGSIESTPIVWKGRIIVGVRDGKIYSLGTKEVPNS